jgi:hypothetical protein
MRRTHWLPTLLGLALLVVAGCAASPDLSTASVFDVASGSNAWGNEGTLLVIAFTVAFGLVGQANGIGVLGGVALGFGLIALIAFAAHHITH